MKRKPRTQALLHRGFQAGRPQGTASYVGKQTRLVFQNKEKMAQCASCSLRTQRIILSKPATVSKKNPSWLKPKSELPAHSQRLLLPPNRLSLLMSPFYERQRHPSGLIWVEKAGSISDPSYPCPLPQSNNFPWSLPRALYPHCITHSLSSWSQTNSSHLDFFSTRNTTWHIVGAQWILSEWMSDLDHYVILSYYTPTRNSNKYKTTNMLITTITLKIIIVIVTN